MQLTFVNLGLVLVLLTGCKGPLPFAPQPRVYDEQADGAQQFEAALHEAKRDGKRVLLNLGANWCRDSRNMFRLLQQHEEIRRVIDRHYVLAMVDVNRRGPAPRNADVVARFDDVLSRGIPVLLVLDAGGRLLNVEPAERLADTDHRDPDKVLAYLRKWAADSRLE